MKSIKSFIVATLIIALFLFVQTSFVNDKNHVSLQSDAGRITVPLGGNTWASDNTDANNITDNGIENWANPGNVFTTYIRLAETGTIKVWLNMKIPQGNSVFELSVKGVTKQIKAEGDQPKDYYAGEWTISDTGYIAFKLKGISKTGNIFAHVSNFQLEGTAINEHTSYVKNNEGNFFYWGRRGPSVHLNYITPQNENVEWFYNEVTVPKGQDIIGSYFMADGFGEGYFGMQVNSPTERHILFSVWSPFTTDNPKDIPDDKKIELLKKGDYVHMEEFGNEGSGGQSYLNYAWIAGNTYKFLLHGHPDGKNHTIYTAYFFAPEKNTWQLIASFRRPETNVWLKHLYSFLENFEPAYGDKERHTLFGNQWVRTDEGQWTELNKIIFSADNTARKGYRMDYSGGVKGDKFFLRNCGFFDDYTNIDSKFERRITNAKPLIYLKKLP